MSLVPAQLIDCARSLKGKKGEQGCRASEGRMVNVIKNSGGGARQRIPMCCE